MNISDRGALTAIEAIVVEHGIEKGLEVLEEKVKAETPLEKAVLSLLRRTLETDGLEAYKAAKVWLRRATEKNPKPPIPWTGPDAPPLRELSDALAAIQQAERGERHRLRRAAMVAAHVGRPFVLALAKSLLAA